MVNHPALRPDIGDDEIFPAEELAPDDELLNSLCQFDIAYCFVVAAEGVGRGRYYPTSAAFNEDRAQPIGAQDRRRSTSTAAGGVSRSRTPLQQENQIASFRWVIRC